MIQSRNLLRFFFVIFFLSSCSRPPNWLVYYNNTLDPKILEDINLAIVDADNLDVSKLKNNKTKFACYVSVGEAEEFRNYWSLIKGKSFVLEENPNWPGDYRIDIRSAEWQDILLNQLIPKIIAKGCDGIFLDTIDTAAYFEELDKDKYKGSKQALTSLIKNIRKKFPKAIIIPNGGLETLSLYEQDVDGIVIEDLYTRHDFATKTNTKTPEADSLYKEQILDSFITRTKKPVYNILYVDSASSPLARYGIARSKAHRYDWYITTVDLMSIGTVQSHQP